MANTSGQNFSYFDLHNTVAEAAILCSSVGLQAVVALNHNQIVWKNRKKQAGAGAVPSSELVKSCFKIEFFLLEIQKKKHDEFLMKLR